MMIPRILVGMALAATFLLVAMQGLGCEARPAPKGSTQAASSQAATEPSPPELAFELRKAEAFYAGDDAHPMIDLQLYGADRCVHAWLRLPKELTGPVSQKIDPASEWPGVWLVSGAGREGDFYKGGVQPPPNPMVQRERATAGLLEGQSEAPGSATQSGRGVITLRNLRFPSGVIRQIGPVEVQIGYYAP